MRIGIMGGTYSPPHIGHMHAAQSAREHLNIDKLIFIPAGIPPHKTLPKHTPKPEQRLQMARIAAQTLGAEVSDIEICRGGISYTADTLEQLKDENELFLIIGTDMFLTVQDWYQPERIFRAATLAVVARDDNDAVKISDHAKRLNKLGARVEIVPCHALPISSSELRERIAEPEMRRYLPDGVWEYIVQEQLYGIS